MKILVTESQYRKILSEEKEQKVFHIPSLKIFSGDWDLLQKFLKHRGNQPYSFGGNLNLRHTEIESLGNLQSVGGYLDLEGTAIKSLGNLKSVDGYLDLKNTPIESLGNLKSVARNLGLRGTPLSKMYTKKQIRGMVNVGGEIYF